MTTHEIELLGKSIVDRQMSYEVIGFEQVADILGVSIRWIQKHIEEIPHGEFNGKPRFFKYDVIRMIRR